MEPSLPDVPSRSPAPGGEGRETDGNGVMKMRTPRPYGGYAKPFDENALMKQIDLEAPLMRWSRALIILDALQELIESTRSDPITVTAVMNSGLMDDWVNLLAGPLRHPSGARRPQSLFRLVPIVDDLVGATRKLIAKNPPKGRSRRFIHRRQLARVREVMVQ